MKLSLSTQSLLVACFLSAPLLVGADGCGGRVEIGGDDLPDGGKSASGGNGGSAGSAGGGSGTAGSGGKNGSAGGGGGGVVCGPVTCQPGLVCCNASCGVCTPPGGACDTLACVPCTAQDAVAQGQCFRNLGYAWDGDECVPLFGCSCEGPGCGALYPSPGDCLNAHNHCPREPLCPNETQAIRDFIEANKACSTSADCRMAVVGCGITEDDCTGTVYLSQRANSATLESLRKDFYACKGGPCGTCLRLSPPPACIAGRCQRAGCESERQALYQFMNDNKACNTTADCQGFQAGCGVSEDGCTGTVYVNMSSDRAVFDTLVRRLATCMGEGPGCATCDRVAAAPVCSAGICESISSP